MKKMWTAVLVAVTLGIAAPAIASTDGQPARQARGERIQQLRQRAQERRAERVRRLGADRVQQLRERRQARIDRNHDGKISRREAIRARLATRRALRRGIR